MLSFNGFKLHLNNIEHYTTLYHAHKEEAFLEIADKSKRVLLKHYQEQQKEIERLTEENASLDGIAISFEKTNEKAERYKKALERIAFDDFPKSTATNEVIIDLLDDIIGHLDINQEETDDLWRKLNKIKEML